MSEWCLVFQYLASGKGLSLCLLSLSVVNIWLLEIKPLAKYDRACYGQNTKALLSKFSWKLMFRAGQPWFYTLTWTHFAFCVFVSQGSRLFHDSESHVLDIFFGTSKFFQKKLQKYWLSEVRFRVEAVSKQKCLFF